jgi:hypothetical protein
VLWDFCGTTVPRPGSSWEMQGAGLVIAFAQPLTAYMLIGWMVAMGAFLGLLLLKVKIDQ